MSYEGLVATATTADKYVWKDINCSGVCTFVWKPSTLSSVDATTLTASAANDDDDAHQSARQSMPFGLQLANICEDRSCVFLLDKKIPSTDLTCEMKAYKCMTENSKFKLFKYSNFMFSGKYSDLFPAAAGETENHQNKISENPLDDGKSFRSPNSRQSQVSSLGLQRSQTLAQRSTILRWKWKKSRKTLRRAQKRIATTYIRRKPGTEVMMETAEVNVDNAEMLYDRTQQHQELSLTVTRSTYREAIIEWTCMVASIDLWMVVIRNKGRIPKLDTDTVQTSEWMIVFEETAFTEDIPYKRQVDQDLVQLEYSAGCMYSIVVIGLKEVGKMDENKRYVIVAQAENSFRSEHTKEDLQKLLGKARAIREHCRETSDFRRCIHLYRDKPSDYFREIKLDRNNVMEVYYKDANGDPASVIHGQLKGLFFSANVDFRTGKPMSPSRFGEVRIKIPILKLLSEDNNLYFADLYCINTTHLVTLVVTERDSNSDRFCRERLPPISKTERTENPFLFLIGEEFQVSSRITVEVLYTENIDLSELQSRYEGHKEEFYGWKDNRHGGKWKRRDCTECNLYTKPITGAFVI